MAASLRLCLAVFCIASSLRHGEGKSYDLLEKKINEIVDANDRVDVPEIVFDTPDLELKFKNATMVGFKACRTTDLVIEEATSSFSFKLECPTVGCEATYELSGKINNIEVEKGEGDFKIELTNYDFIFKGNYAKDKDSDRKQYIQFGNYELDTVLRGTVKFYFGHLHGAGRKGAEESKKFFEENAVVIEKALRKRPTTLFMAAFMHKLNENLKTVPAKALGFSTHTFGLASLPALAVNAASNFFKV